MNFANDTVVLPASVRILGSVLLLAGLAADAVLTVCAVRRPPDWPGMVRRLRDRPWTWSDAGVILLALVTLYAVLALFVTVAGEFFPLAEGEISYGFLVVQTALFNVTGLAIVGLIVCSRRVSWKMGFGLGWRRLLKDVTRGAFFYIAAMPVVVAVTLVYNRILAATGFSLEPQGVIRILSEPGCPSWLFVYMAALAVTAAPVVEELIFRGITLPLFVRHLGLRRGICLVSLFFAFLHFNVPAVVPLFVIAVAFSMAYVYTGSIVVAMVMHALFNGVSLAVFVLVRDIAG